MIITKVYIKIFPNLSHQELKSTLCLHNACDAIDTLFETALAVCNEDFLLKVSYLSVPVTHHSTITSEPLRC